MGQKRAVSFNSAMVLMYTNKGGECRAAVEALTKAYPESEEPALIMAALLLREKKTGEAVSYLDAAIKAKPDGLKLRLTKAQLLVAQGQKSDAVAELRGLADEAMRYAPGTVATVAALMPQSSEAQETVKEALAWWVGDGADSTDEDTANRTVSQLSVALAEMYEEAGANEKAAKLYQELLDGVHCAVEPEEQVNMLARLVKTLAKFDPEQAEERATMLPTDVGGGDEEEFDVDELEASVAPSLNYAYRARARSEKRAARASLDDGEDGDGGGESKGDGGGAAAAPTVSLGVEEATVRRKEKVAARKAKVKAMFLQRKAEEKGCSVDKLPQPHAERWMARRDQAANIKWTKKNRKRAVHKSGGHQGGGGEDEDDGKLDAMARADQRAAERQAEAEEEEARAESKRDAKGSAKKKGLSAEQRRSRKKKKGRGR